MSDKNKNRTTEYVARGVVAGTLGGMSASMYYADKKPKNMVPRKPGLKTPTAKSIAKVESRLLNTHRLYRSIANDIVLASGKTKTGDQINKSYLTGKDQTKADREVKLNRLFDKSVKKFNQKSANLGNRTRRISAAMDSPKNKAIRTMGKVLNVVRGGSAIGAISYAASSTPVGDATIHKGFQQKAFKKSDRPLKLPK